MSAPGGATVLVIDDDGSWRSALARWLEDDGFRVAGVSRADWAESAVETHAPNVVILDVHAPGFDGLELLSTMRRCWPGLPVIVTTAFGGPGIGDAARRQGATCYLEKPFRMARLMSELRRLTGTAGCSATGPGR